MNVTIVGAGNMGLAMTGYLAARGKADVILFTGKNVLENGELRVRDVEKAETWRTRNFRCADDPRTAFPEADMVFVTYPAFLRKGFLERYGGYLKKGAFLGFVPGYGGAEYACGKLIDRGVRILGFQRVPYVARASADEAGWTAGILSRKSRLFLGAIPFSETREASRRVESLLDIPVQPLKEYLSITLAPSNPLLHITGLYHVFKNYEKGQAFDRQLRFYEEWDDEASEMLFAYDNELQNICKALAPLDMSEVVPLPVYYESPTPEKMTRKLKSIEPFKVVPVPLKKRENGYQIDIESRMFAEDYPFGVCVIKDFAGMTGTATPTVDLLLDFYERLSGHRYFEKDGSYTPEIAATGIPGNSGLDSVEKIIRFYHR